MYQGILGVVGCLVVAAVMVGVLRSRRRRAGSYTVAPTKRTPRPARRNSVGADFQELDQR